MGPVISDAQFHQQALDAGSTRHFRTLRAPESTGYAVGGAGMSERSIPAAEFTQAHVAEHLAAMHERFGMDPEMHQGAWREGPDVVLDASNVVQSKPQARLKGLLRKERAIYDLGAGKDIPLPRRAVQ